MRNRAIESGERKLIGVNYLVKPQEKREIEIFKLDDATEQRQLERLRSIKAEHWRRLRRDARTFAPSGAHGDDERDPAPDPERSLAATEALAALDRMFADDPAIIELMRQGYGS